VSAVRAQARDVRGDGQKKRARSHRGEMPLPKGGRDKTLQGTRAAEQSVSRTEGQQEISAGGFRGRSVRVVVVHEERWGETQSREKIRRIDEV
jgi:hypothetical protein